MPSIILSDNGVSSGSAGIKTSGSNDGTLALQTTTAAGTATTAQTIGTDQVTTFAQAANLPNTFGFKNRLINGAMVFDQRNSGASSSVTNGFYYLDRFCAYSSTASDYTIGQNLNSVTPPVGFQKYLGIQSAIATSPGSGDYHFIAQQIEASNLSDLAWGSANAATVSLSFWVRSSLTGTMGGAVTNAASNRSYPFSYTIGSANTWEYKTIVIPGDQSGTWVLSGTTSSMYVRFAFGTGSTRSGTANTWASANYDGPTGATAVTATSGATWYVTGIQLEKGVAATSFDFRSYGQELALCQRYYQQIVSGAGAVMGPASYFSSTRADGVMPLAVSMRTTPSFSITTGSNYYRAYIAGNSYNSTSVSFNGCSSNFTMLLFYNSSMSGLANGAGWWESLSASANIGVTAEL